MDASSDQSYARRGANLEQVVTVIYMSVFMTVPRYGLKA